MTDTCTEQTLEDRKLELELALGRAQKEHARNPHDPAPAEEVGRLRVALQLLEDEAAGQARIRQEVAERERERERKEKLKADRAACSTSLKSVDELKAISDRIHAHVDALVNDVGAYNALVTKLTSGAPSEIRGSLRELRPTHRPLEQLVSAMLIDLGLVWAGMDAAEARMIFESLDFGKWMSARLEEARATIERFRASLDPR